MNQIIKALLHQTISLTETELDFIVSLFREIKLKKGEFFLKEGDACTEIAIVNYGLLRVFSLVEDQKISLFFSDEGQVVTSIGSFLSNEPSRFSIQAVIDAKLFVITKLNIELVYSTIPNAHKLSLEVFESIARAFNTRIEQLLTIPPLEMYYHLIAKYPELIKNVPVKELASFMNITPQHLSRLRKL
jgi:CRP-like cAMP-binding protein